MGEPIGGFMISKQFFASEMTKVFDQFGANKFSSRKMDLIFNSVRWLKQEDLCRVIDSIIGELSRAPNVSDFQERARQFSSKREVKQCDCSICGGSGIVSVRKKSGEVGNYAFACNCEAGHQYPKFPKWHDSLAKEFTRQVVPASLSMKFHGVENWEDYRAKR